MGRTEWRDWVGRVPAFAQMPSETEREIFQHMLASEILSSDQGALSFGREGERSYGTRNFLEVLSVFATLALFTVLHGRTDVGRVHHSSLQAKKGELPILLLGGRSWLVKHVDWEEGVAYVEPTQDRGRSRWPGDSRSLSFELCRAMREVVIAGACPGELTSRAKAQLDELAADFAWLSREGTTLLREKSGDLRWWTFAGMRANGALGAATELAVRQPDNLSIPLDPSVDERALREKLSDQSAEENAAQVPVPASATASLKFAGCLPEGVARGVLVRRWSDVRAVVSTLEESMASVGHS